VVTAEGAIPDVDVVGNEMLGSIFRNLLQNAIQHNDKTPPEVTVSTAEADDRIEIYIADNGPGIPDAQKEEIFGRGEKGLESSGAGIGLYLVQSLVDGYGGDVWVEDNDPEGSVFVVSLPIAE
jgi:signal transduction histidine kinase